MATKPDTTTRAFHYFTSSMLHWNADDDRAQCEQRQRAVDIEGRSIVKPNGYNVWRVPGQCFGAAYKISHYSPQVEGAEFLEFVPYVEEKELPPKRLRKPRAARRR